jgi:CBS domain-containing protein
VTDRDLVVRVLAEGKDPYATPVQEIMTKNPKMVSEGTSVTDALRLMRSGGFRRLPVLNVAGELLGILTLDDIWVKLAEEFSQVGEVLARQTPRAAATAR